MDIIFRRGRSKSISKSAPTDGKIVRRKSTLAVSSADSVLMGSKKETPTDFIEDKRDILISKGVIDFGLGEDTCPIHEELEDVLVLANNTSKKIKFKFEASGCSDWRLTFDPSSGSIDPVVKKRNTKKINVKMTLLVEKSVEERMKLIVNGTDTYFINVKAHVAQGVYGVNPASLDFTTDAGFNVPSVLAQMKHHLVEQEAYRVEGIFRLAGNATEMMGIKEQINRTRSFDIADAEVNAVANLLKVWYRELPEPILNCLPTEVICNSGEMETCVEAFEGLQDTERTLLGWLISLLADVAAFKSINKMSEQNLAIVVAPNLYNPPSQDPMEGLVLSQKSTQFVHNLILHEIERREANTVHRAAEFDLEKNENSETEESNEKEKEKEKEKETENEEEGDY